MTADEAPPAAAAPQAGASGRGHRPEPDSNGLRSEGPKRIQRRRSKGWRLPEGVVYVGRPSRWGNPYAVSPAPDWPRWAGPRPSVVTGPKGETWQPPESRRVIVGRAAAERSSRMMAAQMAVDMYRELVTCGHMSEDFFATLAGHDLACWCPLDQPCHADVLLQIANEDPS